MASANRVNVTLNLTVPVYSSTHRQMRQIVFCGICQLNRQTNRCQVFSYATALYMQGLLTGTKNVAGKYASQQEGKGRSEFQNVSSFNSGIVYFNRATINCQLNYPTFGQLYQAKHEHQNLYCAWYHQYAYFQYSFIPQIWKKHIFYGKVSVDRYIPFTQFCRFV